MSFSAKNGVEFTYLRPKIRSYFDKTDRLLELNSTGTGRCGGGHYGGGHYGGGRYGGGRYGGAFQFRVDATAEPPDTHITMDATAGWG